MKQRLRSQDGQAMVEFALILPLFVTLLFALIEFGIAFNNYLRVTDIARVAARDVAVARLNPGSSAYPSCTNLATSPPPQADGLDTLKLSVACSNGDPGNPLPGDPQPGEQFTVTVTYPWSLSIPFIPGFSGTLTSKATERAE